MVDAEQRCAERRREDAELRLFERLAGEGEVGDQQGHGERDPADGAAAQDAGPADRRPDPPRLARVISHDVTVDGERLSDHVRQEDADRDRGSDRERPRRVA